ncbi:type III-B CRISPR module RAMP protein Cmr1 [bacterium]|nr:type III-B CRISPR module RAMP protein Cmr1 [bacterium]
MYAFIAECQVITPMFMAGADGRTPELRPSEFKGMMRFWWRATKAEDNIEKLKEEENKIFGGTGEKEGKSKIKLIIHRSDLSIGDCVQSEIPDSNGLKYLYYSTFSLKSSIRKYIKPGNVFKINISSFEKQIFDQALASLWLAIYLGGFGTRARRGGGNIVVERVINIHPESSKLSFTCNANSRGDLKAWVSENINMIKNIVNQSNGTFKYSTLKNGKILIFNPKNSWKDALNFIGEKFKNFRTKYKTKIFETAVFGMPVMYPRFRVRIVPYDNKRLSERWSSPLFMKVIKVENDNYYPIVTQLSPGGIDFVGKEIKKENSWNIEDKERFKADLLNEFISWLETSNSEEIEL